MKKTKELAEAKARLYTEKLKSWLPQALVADDLLARKVACIVWYDFISSHGKTDPYILRVVQKSPDSLPVDTKEVIQTLVKTFDYDRKFAEWRMNGRISR